MRTLVLSLGGSIICPDDIDYFFLKRFKALILDYIGSCRFVIFCGGGRVNSRYNQAAQRVSAVSDEDLDWIGIMASRLNAELVRAVFGDLASRVVTDPRRIASKKSIIIGAGWKPGWSTDFDAVLAARAVGATEIANLSNIAYIYDRDPRKDKDARAIYEMTWKEYRRLVGSRWSPRMSSPFDPIAAKEAAKNRMKVAILKGTDIDNLRLFLDGKPFEGSIIH